MEWGDPHQKRKEVGRYGANEGVIILDTVADSGARFDPGPTRGYWMVGDKGHACEPKEPCS